MAAYTNFGPILVGSSCHDVSYLIFRKQMLGICATRTGCENGGYVNASSDGRYSAIVDLSMYDDHLRFSICRGTTALKSVTLKPCGWPKGLSSNAHREADALPEIGCDKLGALVYSLRKIGNIILPNHHHSVLDTTSPRPRVAQGSSPMSII